MAWMDWSLRSSRAMETGAGRWRGRAFLMAVALVLSFSAQQAHAQAFGPPPPPPPTAPPPSPSIPASDLSSGAAITNLGSNFLERLGDQASGGSGRAPRSNPGGGGASEALDGPTFRTWGEAYGISSKTGPQANFVGDDRTTTGGVAGFGARIAPGVNVGFSIDQSRTGIDVPLAMQSATLDLTQLGFNASVDKGPWTWALAAVHGFGNVNSRRDTGFGIASAGYAARLDGVLPKLSYYWSLDQSRIVPKAGFEHVRSSTAGLQEFGGLDPVM